MVDTIEKTLKPLYLTACFLGFGILKYPLNHSNLRFSIFYILTMWSIYAYVFHHIVIIFAPRSIFSSILDYFMVVINLCITIISIIMNFRKRKEFHGYVRKIGLVDDTLEELGIPKEYRKMQNSVTWVMIAWIIVMWLTWFISSFWFIRKFNDTKAIVIPFIKYYTVHINTLIDIMFMFLLRYIAIRLDKINNYIGQLETEKYGLRCIWKKSLVTRHHVQSAKDHKRVLWITMQLHLELCQIARNVNDLFGMQMTLQMISYFIILIWMICYQYRIMLCQIYGNSTERLEVSFCTYIWFILCLVKIILFNHICESVSVKAQKTRSAIHKLTNLICFTEAHEEICQFLLQISLRPLKFSGIGLFYFGYKFIGKFFVWIITAVVFFLQMDNSTISRLIISGWNNCSYNYVEKDAKL